MYGKSIEDNYLKLFDLIYRLSSCISKVIRGKKSHEICQSHTLKFTLKDLSSFSPHFHTIESQEK